ncbi:hypothetical protein Ciccas_005764 [Cichlidogyrus casuarinus]|uniref:Uncharacterized protein n=1 Tax=Cichlidogyrus casuarinus TaxID=1844966 RepID=A0ABD2Q7Q7_9PLAT
MPGSEVKEGNSSTWLPSWLKTRTAKLINGYWQPSITENEVSSGDHSVKNFLKVEFLPVMRQLAQMSGTQTILDESKLGGALNISSKNSSYDLQSLLAALVICSKNEVFVDALSEHVQLVVGLVARVDLDTKEKKPNPVGKRQHPDPAVYTDVGLTFTETPTRIAALF